MKIEGKLFVIVAVFLLPVTGLYAWLSWLLDGQVEWVGTTGMGLTFGLCALVGFYLLFTGSWIDPRPEDNPEAEPSDGAGELGFFSPHSWWPLFLAMSAAATTLAMVFGWWMVYLTMPILILAVIGWVFEYYRGEHLGQ